MDGHAVSLRLSRLPVPALRLHPAEGGLLQLVSGHDRTRQNHHQHHRPLNPTLLTLHPPQKSTLPENPLPPPRLRPIPLLEYYRTLKAHHMGDSLFKWAKKQTNKQRKDQIHYSACFVALLVENNTFFVVVQIALLNSFSQNCETNSPCTKLSSGFSGVKEVTKTNV